MPQKIDLRQSLRALLNDRNTKISRNETVKL